MVIGKEAPLGPTSVKATSITSTSAVISWLPSNSNFQHTVCVNNVEVRTVKPGVYRHTITGEFLFIYLFYFILYYFIFTPLPPLPCFFLSFLCPRLLPSCSHFFLCVLIFSFFIYNCPSSSFSSSFSSFSFSVSLLSSSSSFFVLQSFFYIIVILLVSNSLPFCLIISLSHYILNLSKYILPITFTFIPTFSSSLIPFLHVSPAGLSPNTTYRVTIRAKNLRAPQFDGKTSRGQERLSTTIEFRTLPKGECLSLVLFDFPLFIYLFLIERVEKMRV